MISLFSELYNVTLEENSDTDTPSASARIDRQATLDGGVAFTHLGVCHGDRTFQIRARVSKDQADDLRAMFENETVVYCATSEGVFAGAISRIQGRNGEADISFMVREKL